MKDMLHGGRASAGLGVQTLQTQSHNAHCMQYKMHHNHDIHMMHIMQNTNIARRTKCTMHVCKRYKRRAHVGPIVCAPPPPQSETIRCQLTIVSNEFVRSTFDGKSHLCVYYCTDKISEAVLYFC